MGFGPPIPEAKSTLLELDDTPSSYEGQALKLVKVNAGETASVFALLLSFTDWYAGGAPNSYPWEFEAVIPFAYDYNICLSPILKNILGQYYVYAIPCENVFYLYNITTKQWHRLADPVTTKAQNNRRPPALSPNKEKLAIVAANRAYIEIYDIEANTWAASSIAPNLAATTPDITKVVWVDDDTVWACVRANVPPFTVKFYRYVVSTDTWTQFTNSITPSDHDTRCMACNNDGSILYAGGVGSENYYYTKYVISTDTYSSGNVGSQRQFFYCADRTRLWYIFEGDFACYYLDCEDESTHGVVFPTNPQRDKPSLWTLGVYELSACIGEYRAAAPRLMSYFGSGSWRLAQKVLTDYNLVVFKKPADGFAISAVDKVNGYYIPIHLFSTLTLPAGTWEFFYPKDGDYTKLKISGSELK